jgi:hypothetical protein
MNPRISGIVGAAGVALVVSVIAILPQTTTPRVLSQPAAASYITVTPIYGPVDEEYYGPSDADQFASGFAYGFVRSFLGSVSSGGCSVFNVGCSRSTARPAQQGKAPLVVPYPSCTISASPSSVRAGDAVTLVWSSVNAERAAIDGVGPVSKNNIYTIHPVTSVTYTMRVYDSLGRTRSCSTPITVAGASSSAGTQQPAPQTAALPPSCTISASRSDVRPGEPVTLIWDSVNTEEAFINAFGHVAKSSIYVVRPQSSATYTMKVTNSAGVSASCSTSVKVCGTVAPNGTQTTQNSSTQLYGRAPEEYRYPSVQLTSDPMVNPGIQTSCTLRAESPTIRTGETGYLQWSLPRGASGYVTDVGQVFGSGFQAVHPSDTEVYTMTVVDAYGGSSSCTATITVIQ